MFRFVIISTLDFAANVKKAQDNPLTADDIFDNINESVNTYLRATGMLHHTCKPPVPTCTLILT